MAQEFISAQVSVKVGSLEDALENVQFNFSPKEYRREVKNAWNHIKKPLIADFKKLIPVKKGGYPLSHPNVIKYRRKPGALRKTVKLKHAQRVPRDAMPNAYLRIDGYPFNFLVSGTIERETDDGKNLGSIPDLIDEGYFYDVIAPLHLENAAIFLENTYKSRNPYS